MGLFDLVNEASGGLLDDLDKQVNAQKASISASQNAAIDERLAGLPADGVTVAVLKAMDSVVPGEWVNVRDYDEMVRRATGESAPQIVAQIRGRALELWASEPKYKQALTVFTTIDSLDKIAAGAAVANKVGDLFGGLDFLKSVTPKPETTQAIDAGLKLTGELVGFGLLQGMPELTFDGIARFVVALADYGRADLMRIASWVALDGMLPLGPSFMSKITEQVTSLANDQLSGNGAFEQLGDKLPGESVEDKRAFVVQAVQSTEEWVNKFIEEKQLTPERVKASLGSALSVAEGGIDYVAAAVDATTSYFSHTGVQTVSRVLAEHACASLKEDVWKQYVAQHQ